MAEETPPASPVVGARIADFEPRWRGDFERLNVEWLERWFTVEPVDREVLANPEVHILAHGKPAGSGGVYAVGGDGRPTRHDVESWLKLVEDAEPDGTAPYALFLLDLSYSGNVARREWQHALPGDRRRAWVLAAVLGVFVFDILRGTSASYLTRYALAGLPAAMLLVSLAVEPLPSRARSGFLALLVLAWSAGAWPLITRSARPGAAYGTLARALETRLSPSDLVLVHSVPSGVIALSRYLDPELPRRSGEESRQGKDQLGGNWREDVLEGDKNGQPHVPQALDDADHPFRYPIEHTSILFALQRVAKQSSC